MTSGRTWQLVACAIVGMMVAVADGGPVVVRAADGMRDFKVAMLLHNTPTDFTWNYRHNLGRISMIQNLLNKYSDLRVNSTFGIVGLVRTEEENNKYIADTLDLWGREKYHLVLTTSFYMQDPTLLAAEKYPDTNWVHISGFKSGPPNFAVAWCRVFQARWLSGMVAASQTKTLKLGYAAAFPFIPEVVRGFNAYTLGARRMDPRIKVLTNFLMTWADTPRTILATEWLYALGCDVIAGHTNDAALYAGFIDRGLKGIGYYTDMKEQYGDSVVVSAYFDWGNMYTRFAEETMSQTPIASAFDGMETRVPVMGTMTQYVPNNVRETVLEWEQKLIQGADAGPGGSSGLIFCGPMNDEYGVPMLHNSSDCADPVSHPHPSFQQFGGGLLNMEWFVEGVEDIGMVPLPHEVCGAGFKYTWNPLGKKVMDNARHQAGAGGAGKEKIRFDFTCDPCPPGTHAPVAGSTVCLPCGLGKEAPGDNYTECMSCPVGTYAPSNGTVSCLACPEGFTNSGNGNEECDIKIAEDGWVTKNWWVLVLIFVLLIGIVVPPLCWYMTKQQREMARLFNNNAVAESCAESIAAMNLEEVEYIKQIQNPNKIQLAFITIVDNLIEYRRYLPASVLAGEDEKEGTESRMSTTQRSSEPGNRSVQSAASKATQKTKLAGAQMAKMDAKFMLSLKSKRVAMAVLAPSFCSADTETSGAFNELIATVEESLKLYKVFLQVNNANLSASANTVFNAAQPGLAVGKAMVHFREKWETHKHGVAVHVHIGVEANRALCGNVGTENQRHYVAIPAKSTFTGHLAGLIGKYAARQSPKATLILSEDATAAECKGQLVTRQIDLCAMQFGSGGPITGIHELQAVRDGGDNDEWMYKLDEQEKEVSVSNSFNKAWDKLKQGHTNNDVLGPAIADIETAAKSEKIDLSQDPAWERLSNIIKQLSGSDKPTVDSHISLVSNFHIS
eukprot:Hpha_TRINITY_DN16348_c0_g4::TRINITY_DN16348_c0_g4_i5::g.59327::m.59327